MSQSIAERLGPHWWTPDGKERTEKFHIRPLDGFEFLQTRNHVTKVTRNKIFLDEDGYRFVIDRCVLGWENVRARDGRPLEFKPESKPQLQWKHIDEIVGQVLMISTLSEAEEKN